MPIEIRELIIRATVNSGESGKQGRKKSEGKADDAFIEACVEQVLEILRKKKER
jgi:hypothetical protein